MSFLLWLTMQLVMCRCPHMSLEMRQELADNIAAVFAFAFHSKKYFLWAAGIDIVCDTVCSKAKFSDHLSRSERQVLFGDVCSLREFGNGSLIAATIASRSWLSSKLSRRRTGVRWLANLVSPYRAFGYRDNDIDGSSKCTGCYGKRPRLLPAPGEENGRLFYDVAIKERLSVSVYAVRRGWDHSTKDLERDFHYICLVVLIWLEYHDGFIIIFLYFACLVHQQDRVHRWKMTAILTPQGLYLPAYGIAYADI